MFYSKIDVKTRSVTTFRFKKMLILLLILLQPRPYEILLQYLNTNKIHVINLTKRFRSITFYSKYVVCTISMDNDTKPAYQCLKENVFSWVPDPMSHLI